MISLDQCSSFIRPNKYTSLLVFEFIFSLTPTSHSVGCSQTYNVRRLLGIFLDLHKLNFPYRVMQSTGKSLGVPFRYIYTTAYNTGTGQDDRSVFTANFPCKLTGYEISGHVHATGLTGNSVGNFWLSVVGSGLSVPQAPAINNAWTSTDPILKIGSYGVNDLDTYNGPGVLVFEMTELCNRDLNFSDQIGLSSIEHGLDGALFYATISLYFNGYRR